MSNGSNQSWGITVLRIVVGIVFLAHGAQKVFTFGHHGVTGMLGSMGIPLPSVMSVVLMAVEFLGGAALVLGAFFVVGQGLEWLALLRHGLTLTSSQLGSFFYLIVGLHATRFDHIFASSVSMP